MLRTAPHLRPRRILSHHHYFQHPRCCAHSPRLGASGNREAPTRGKSTTPPEPHRGSPWLWCPAAGRGRGVPPRNLFFNRPGIGAKPPRPIPTASTLILPPPLQHQRCCVLQPRVGTSGNRLCLPWGHRSLDRTTTWFRPLETSATLTHGLQPTLSQPNQTSRPELLTSRLTSRLSSPLVSCSLKSCVFTP